MPISREPAARPLKPSKAAAAPPAKVAAAPAWPGPVPAATVAPAATATPAATTAPAKKPASTTAAGNLPAMDATAIWRKLLDYLADAGQMTLYLFSRTATVSLCGQTLQIIFAPNEQIHYNELHQTAAQKILREALHQITGEDFQVAVLLAEDPAAAAASCPVPQEDEWIQKLRQTADTFGIPLKMEDE
jgi:hypothetical protein